MWIHRNTHEKKKIYLKAAAERRKKERKKKNEQNVSRNKTLHSAIQGNVLVRHILELSKLFSKAA